MSKLQEQTSEISEPKILDNDLVKSVLEIENALPATALVAITLFCIKELLEFCRRRKSERRQLTAINRLLSDEIERNKWTLKVVKNCAASFESAAGQAGYKIFLKDEMSGVVRFCNEKNGEGYGSWPLSEVKEDQLQSNLQKLADLDRKNFTLALDAHDALKELQHLRISIMDHANDESTKYRFGELANYLREEAEEIEKTLGTFYREITGKELTKHRLR